MLLHNYFDMEDKDSRRSMEVEDWQLGGDESHWSTMRSLIAV